MDSTMEPWLSNPATNVPAMNQCPSAETWNLKWPVCSLAGYVFLVYPLGHFLPGDPRRFFNWIEFGYFLLVMTVLMVSRRVTLRQLGFRGGAIGRHLILGFLPGMALAGMVPLLDWFIDATRIGQSELFAGAEKRVSANSGTGPMALGFAFQVLAVPLIQQTYFTGFFLPALFRVVKPVTAIYLMAVIFVLVHFELKLSLFLIGLICSSFFYLTGTIWAPLLFHTSCALAGWMLTWFYPRVVTFLAFLF